MSHSDTLRPLVGHSPGNTSTSRLSPHWWRLWTCGHILYMYELHTFQGDVRDGAGLHDFQQSVHCTEMQAGGLLEDLNQTWFSVDLWWFYRRLLAARCYRLSDPQRTTAASCRSSRSELHPSIRRHLPLPGETAPVLTEATLTHLCKDSFICFCQTLSGGQ